jgi:hypothetical protein
VRLVDNLIIAALHAVEWLRVVFGAVGIDTDELDLLVAVAGAVLEELSDVVEGVVVGVAEHSLRKFEKLY